MNIQLLSEIYWILSERKISLIELLIYPMGSQWGTFLNTYLSDLVVGWYKTRLSLRYHRSLIADKYANFQHEIKTIIYKMPRIIKKKNQFCRIFTINSYQELEIINKELQ